MASKKNYANEKWVEHTCQKCDGRYSVDQQRPNKVKFCPFCGVAAGTMVMCHEITEPATGIPGRVGRYIASLLAEKPKFHGNVKVNFNSGGLTNCTKTESEKI